MAQLEFIFCSSNKIFGKLIEGRTFGDWAHCAVRLTEGPEWEDNIVEASFWHGVHKTSIDKLCKKNSRVVGKIITVPENNHETWVAINNEIGKPYDYLAILGAFFRKKSWENPHAWYCSEVDAYISKKCLMPLFDGNEKIITPQMLWTAIPPCMPQSRRVYK